jgi:acylphosphatase
MNKMKCNRVIIKAITSYAIQGINLREKTEEYVRTQLNHDKIRVKGKISNLKNGDVELIFCGKKSDLSKLLDHLSKSTVIRKGQSEVEVIKETPCYEIETESEAFSDFTVERSDDLSEMVWALRGAGIRFKDATDALEKIDKTLIERDRNSAIGRLLTLQNELISNRELLASPNRNTRRKNRERINIVALESNIENPAVPKEEFVYPLMEVYSDLLDFRDGLLQDVRDISNKIDALLKIIDSLLSEKETMST